MIEMKTIRTIDLFAGLGGIRLGFEEACKENGIKSSCVFTSEIKESALKALNLNFPGTYNHTDITKVKPEDIPKFDFLFAGFPCQPFSYAGTSKGFADTRGTLFFDIERILRHHKPIGFILENVEGLVSHDPIPGAKMGRTLSTIINVLEKLDYHVTWKVLDASNFAVAQKRKRIYIVGHREKGVSLNDFKIQKATLKETLESCMPTEDSKIAKKLLNIFKPQELYGKKIKDKRGGADNIHSWDLELKGKVTKKQHELLNRIVTERRKKHWAQEWGIDWMDGMPLTVSQIKSFMDYPKLEDDLEKLTNMGYLRFEHPKKRVKVEQGENIYFKREYDLQKMKGYNIVTGKLSFPINEVLHPDQPTRTLVASDMSRIYVFDECSKGLRKLTRKEGLRLSGYPETYKENFEVSDSEFYDLIGNTVCVPVVKSIATRLIKSN